MSTKNSQPSTPQLTPRQIWIILIGLMSGMFLAALDQSIVSTAMRTIADDLEGLSLQAWATTAYLITSTVSTPIYGKLGDIFGRRPLFLTAIGIFLGGSVLAGLSTSMIELAGFRALQGLGAGGLFSLALTIIADIVPPRERARYQGVFLAVFGTASVMGPLVGGLFAGLPEILWVEGWRWVFLINLPVGAISLIMVLSFLHVPHRPRKARLDWWGAATIILGVVPLLLVAEQGREWGWTSPLSIAMYVTSALGIAAFVLVERKMGDDALIPPSMFSNQTFTRTTILGVFIGAGMFGGMLVLPLVLQVSYGADPTQAGLLMLPMVLGMMISTIASGRITAATGKYRIFMHMGTAILALGYLYLLLVMDATRPIWVISIGMVIVGLGLGQLLQTLTVASQNAVDPRNIGAATSGATFFRQMGGTLGVSVFLSMLFGQLQDRVVGAFEKPEISLGIQEALSDPAVLADPANARIIDLIQAGASGSGSELSVDSSFLIGADDRLTAPFRIGFADSSLPIFGIAAVLVLLAFALSWFIKEIPLRAKSASQELISE